MRAKAIIASMLLIAACFAMAACSGNNDTSKSYTFAVSTNDEIKVELDTTTGYDIAPDEKSGGFVVTKDGETVTQGLFLETSTYDQYAEQAQQQPVFKRNRVRGHDGVYYEDDSSSKKAYVYLIRLNDSNTAIALSTSTTEDEATAVTSALVFTVNPEK